MCDFYYRFETFVIGDCIHVTEEKFSIFKETPKGVWVRSLGPDSIHRFILNKARKKFAHPNRDVAWESFQRRQRKRIGHARRSLKIAKAALILAAHCNPDDALDQNEQLFTMFDL